MFATQLRCFKCDRTYPFEATAYTCPSCGSADDDPGILDVEYDYSAAAERLRDGDHLRGDRRDIFRYLPLLPVQYPAALLPVGDTPLVDAPRLATALGVGRVLLKDETRNPTRCLKDRATAVAVTLARSLHRSELYCASAGNAAISLAAFCAHQNLRSHVFVPHRVSIVRLDWLRRFGADVHVSDGEYDAAFDESERAGSEHEWYSRNCALNPFLVEGKKTVALEIGEQLGWTVPDLVVAPVGDGCTLSAVGKGFRELVEVGLTDRTPRLLGVQAEGIQPFVSRLHGQPDGYETGTTQAASIAVHKPRNALRLLRELAASGGDIVAVTEDAIAAAQDHLSTHSGVVAEFTSGATLAGLRKYVESGAAGEVETVVLVITGGRID